MLHAYTPSAQLLQCTLIRGSESKIVTLKTDSDRACNLMAVIRVQYPGWALADCTEAPNWEQKQGAPVSRSRSLTVSGVSIE